MTADRRFSPITAKSYIEALSCFIRAVGDIPATDIRPIHILSYKARLAERNIGPSRVGSLMHGLKCFLTYSQTILELPVMDPRVIKAPHQPRKSVTYLTDEEIVRLLESVPLHTWAGKPRMVGFRFRALLETLLATGMRISECLALNRDSLDTKKLRAMIVGKGNKPRTIFFSRRSIDWILRYLALRPDTELPLFANDNGTRLRSRGVQGMLRRHANAAKIQKKVTPHILRHTIATHLLKNGCPIGAIKEILGHSRLETTCRFYLGVLSTDETQELHGKYFRISDRALPNKEDLLAEWPLMNPGMRTATADNIAYRNGNISRLDNNR
jgi:site-specific recombinase XerD